MRLGPRDLKEACDAWGRTPTTGSGYIGLSLWFLTYKARHGEKGFTVAEYGALVQLVRLELGDDTDYSQEV
jgi:hypothetical protein